MFLCCDVHSCNNGFVLHCIFLHQWFCVVVHGETQLCSIMCSNTTAVRPRLRHTDGALCGAIAAAIISSHFTAAAARQLAQLTWGSAVTNHKIHTAAAAHALQLKHSQPIAWPALVFQPKGGGGGQGGRQIRHGRHAEDNFLLLVEQIV